MLAYPLAHHAQHLGVLRCRGRQLRQLGLHLTEAAIALLAERGYDPVYGARPLKRAIQKLVIDPLATRILAGEFAAGDRIVCDVDGAGAGLHFRPAQPGEGAAAPEVAPPAGKAPGPRKGASA